MRWPEGWFLFLFLFFVFIGGFKGQVRWPKEPPYLALNPPYFLGYCFVLFSFLFLSFSCFLKRKPVFTLKRAFLRSFQSLPLFLPSVLSLSLSLSCYFLSFFLPSLFSLFFVFCFLAYVFLFISLVSIFCFMKRTTLKHYMRKVFFLQSFIFCFSVLLSFQIHFPYLSFFHILSFVFVQHNVLLKKQTPIFGQEGVAITSFLITSVLQNVKSYLFVGGHFLPKLG